MSIFLSFAKKKKTARNHNQFEFTVNVFFKRFFVPSFIQQKFEEK